MPPSPLFRRRRPDVQMAAAGNSVRNPHYRRRRRHPVRRRGAKLGPVLGQDLHGPEPARRRGRLHRLPRRARAGAWTTPRSRRSAAPATSTRPAACPVSLPRRARGVPSVRLRGRHRRRRRHREPQGRDRRPRPQAVRGHPGVRLQRDPASGHLRTPTHPYFLLTRTATGAAPRAETAPAATARSRSSRPRLLRAAYNYLFSRTDSGAWAHNPRYAIEVLFDTIQDLNAGLIASRKTPVAFTGKRAFNGHFGAAEDPSPYAAMIYHVARQRRTTGFTSAACYQCHGGEGGFDDLPRRGPRRACRPPSSRRQQGAAPPVRHLPRLQRR